MDIFNTIVSSSVKTNVFSNENIFIDNDAMSLGNRIKTAREHANLTRDQLADAVGCSYDLLRKLEANLRNSTSFLSRIAKTCGVNFNWLETGAGEMLLNTYSTDERLQVLHKIAQQLPDYALDEVIRDAIKTAELIARARSEKNGTDK